MLKVFRSFIQLESASGILLLIAAVLAIAAENSFLKPLYDALLDTLVQIRIGELNLSKPLLLWINDGLMAVFFFLIGLEVKREFLTGELKEPSRIVLPLIAAIGGMVVPALIYVLFNFSDTTAMNGWAIPSATDIAFSLGVLSLLGTRLPASLKVFLLTLAIIDDLGAIVVIALFYTVDLSVVSLVIASIAITTLFILNRRGVLSLVPYLLTGLILWVAVLKSGVHATLAGVTIAFFIPFRKEAGQRFTQLERLEQDLHPTVTYFILPLFAFANAGIPLEALTLEHLGHPIALGIALGLFFGNQIGIFGLSWLSVRFGIAKKPAGATWLQMYGLAALCGIGFTMSLFISSLAFEQSGINLSIDERVGILLGSLASGVWGYLILRFSLREKTE